MKRRQARKRSGRFTQNTLRNTLGMGSAPCGKCGALNMYDLHESVGRFVSPAKAPTECPSCSAVLGLAS